MKQKKNLPHTHTHDVEDEEKGREEVERLG